MSGKYRIKKGDTLFKIAKENGLSIEELIKVNPKIKDPSLIAIGQEINIPEEVAVENEMDDSPRISISKYSVKSGDNLYKIAKSNGLSLDELLVANPEIKNPSSIFIGQEINIPINKEEEKKVYNLKALNKKEAEINKSGNIAIIHSAKHNSNYAIVDKKKEVIEVYSKQGKLLYKGSIQTGGSHDDFNTITYTDENGKLRNHQGNNSTPAGITRITGKVEYHGHPAFTRGRFNKKTGEWDEDLASSMHFENRTANGSNGCVRLLGNTGDEIAKHLKVGDFVYTLPEKEGSRFELREGSLNFLAENPYGETEGKKKFWDDYNVFIDKTYKPLKISYKNSDINVHDTNSSLDNAIKGVKEKNKEGTHLLESFRDTFNEINDNQMNQIKEENRRDFIQGIEESKEDLMREFDIDSSTYNKFASLALGIAEQESKFGTSVMYRVKNAIPEEKYSTVKRISNALSELKEFDFQGAIDALDSDKTKVSHRSRGITQMKIEGDNKETQEVYDKFGITNESLEDANKSAVGTMIRLLSVYKNEVMGRDFVNQEEEVIDPRDVVLYKYSGQNRQIKNKTETPERNIYIQNVKNYADDFSMETTFKNGGGIMSKKKKNNTVKSVGISKTNDPERWYNAINPGIETSLFSAIIHGPGILTNLALKGKRDDKATKHEEDLWRAYVTGDVSMFPKSNVRFDGDDENAQYIGLPKEQRMLIQAMADTMYTKRSKEIVNNTTYSDIKEDIGMRRSAREDDELAEKIMNNPGKWILVNEGNSPVRVRIGDEKKKYTYTGLGGLKNFSVRWNPETKELDVKDDYDFNQNDVVEKMIPQRDIPLRIRDRIKIDTKKGSDLYRNPDKVKEYGYDKKYNDGGEVSNNTPSEKRIRELVKFINNSDANFVKRLKDKDRKYIKDWEDENSIATHKMSVEIDDNGDVYLFPSVQEIKGELHDFTNPRYNTDAYSALSWAKKNGDIVKFDYDGSDEDRERALREALWFSENYKNLGVYPEFKKGGEIEEDWVASWLESRMNAIRKMTDGGLKEEDKERRDKSSDNVVISPDGKLLNSSIRGSSNEKIDREISLINEALGSYISDKKLSQGLKDAIEKKREEIGEDIKEAKKNTDIALSAVSFLGAIYGIAPQWMNSKFGFNPQKAQVISGLISAAADTGQLLGAESTFDTVEKSIELAGDVSGVVGGTDVMQRIGRYGPIVDKILDYYGKTSSLYDLVKSPYEIYDKVAEDIKRNGGDIKTKDGKSLIRILEGGGESISNKERKKLYREDLERVMRGERAIYFGHLNDKSIPISPIAVPMKDGGWKPGFYNIRLRGGEAPIDRNKYIYDKLTKDYGISSMQAVAIIANLMQESGLDETAQGDLVNGEYLSYGIQQWKGERRKKLFKFAKENNHDEPTLDDQIEFLMAEYHGDKGFNFKDKGKNLYKNKGKNNNLTEASNYYQYSKKDFENAQSLSDAVIAWNQGFGRPHKKYAANKERFKLAEEIAKSLNIGEDWETESLYGEMGFNQPFVDNEEKQAVAQEAAANEVKTPETQKPSVMSSDEKAMQWMRDYGDAMVSQIRAMEEKVSGSGKDETESFQEKQRKAEAESRAKEEANKKAFLAAILPQLDLDIMGTSEESRKKHGRGK